MRHIKLPKNPYILFFPFLILYIIFILAFPIDVNIGDQGSYLNWAEYLLAFDFKELLYDNGRIPNGPGYPIIIMPFVLFKLPLGYFALLNALFLYLSIVLIFKTLKLIVTQRVAVIVSLFWAFYFYNLNYIATIGPDIFTIFLIALLIYSVVKTFCSIQIIKTKKYLTISGITLGFIVLTKVIFGYVVLVLLFGSVLLWLINKKRANLSRVLMILLISIGLFTPYLAYTYYHTDKIFYWATSGGDNLYWMSTPYEGEHGDWQKFESLEQLLTVEQNGINLYNDSNIANHLKVWEEIRDYNEIQQDEKLKRIAINNIKKHPVKFLHNWIGNVGRMLFGYPFSYTLQNPRQLVYFPLNAIISVLFLFSLVPTYKNWHKINFGIRFLILFSLVYLGGSTFGAANMRMFVVIVPVLLLWMAFILQNTIKINFKFNAAFSNMYEKRNRLNKE
jgi:4-amino-4-deoxy-L-arabinose transferase-like glycosyltransferase